MTHAFRAEVAELADALDSGSSARKGVGVRVPASAPTLHRLLHEIESTSVTRRSWRPPAFVLLLALAGLTACGPLPKGEYWQGSFLHSVPPRYSFEVPEGWREVRASDYSSLGFNRAVFARLDAEGQMSFLQNADLEL